ncbi:GFA family protein [Pseudomonas chlororaphis]|uniref:Ribulose phosphate epimerase n=1 Tax=Pseudomonas chlororaphis TaxID=587753 RepID=A0A1Q8ESH8_9PSED|nr:GFA family protein [Pseudomonas chlororaphis]OLF54743.1 ribulose phosphate epimerase [Pseudomonas chlororaphis]
MTDAFLGSCLCGAVAYQLSSRPRALAHCHCSQCRKSHGAAFASYASVPRDDLRLLRGADSLKAYPSSESVLRQFCGQCGSSLFWSRNRGEYADWISVALGTLDTPFTAQKQRHIQVDAKAPWYRIEDAWP